MRKNYTKPEIIERLRETGLFSINIIQDNTKNAVDRALASSLTSLRHKKKITHIILITGDLDYRKLIIETFKWVKRIILISNRKSTSIELTSLISTYYSVENLVNSPETWWKRSLK